MTELSCRTARLWLQAEGELGDREITELQAHLTSCVACAQTRLVRSGVDETLSAWLRAQDLRTVRADVLARIRENQTTTRDRRAGWSSALRRFAPSVRPRYAWLMVPVALTVALVSLLLPQPLGNDNGLQPARAAWNVHRPEIGYALAVDRKRDGHLLAGASGQVYESWNSGASWHQLAPLPPGLVVRAVAMDVAHPQRYLVATKHSIFVSNDAGRRWAMATSSLPGAMNMFLMQDPRIPDTFYVGPSILWKSVDSGATWAPAGSGDVFKPNGIQSLASGPRDTLLTGVWGGGVAISPDNGRTWRTDSAGLPRNVMDVEMGRHGDMWAATDRGLFVQLPQQQRWHAVKMPNALAVTSVLPGPRAVIAAGNGFVYISSDEGKTWRQASSGLPIDPYASNLVSDPRHTGRVFAVLNGDGLFRSDDSGQHWTPIDSGLQLDVSTPAAHLVLFRRTGALWITDTHGTDPGVLTVDRNVALAALAPDGAAVAYVAASPHKWSARVLSASGSAPLTVAHGETSAVRSLMWSPNSALLAVVTRRRVIVSNLGQLVESWAVRGGDRVISWTNDGRGLLTWDSRSGTVAARDWRSGQSLNGEPTLRYPAPPSVSPDGRHVAYVAGHRLAIGRWNGVARLVARLTLKCRVLSWSDDSTRLLVPCGQSVEQWTGSGRFIRSPVSLGTPFWAPRSHSNLLFFRHGLLRVWRPGRPAEQIVRDAYPVSAYR